MLLNLCSPCPRNCGFQSIYYANAHLFDYLKSFSENECVVNVIHLMFARAQLRISVRLYAATAHLFDYLKT